MNVRHPSRSPALACTNNRPHQHHHHPTPTTTCNITTATNGPMATIHNMHWGWFWKSWPQHPQPWLRPPTPCADHIGTLHCSVRYGSRNNYSVVYSRGSRNSVNPQMSLCSARVQFRDSANVSPSSAGIPKRKHLFPKKETNVPVTKMNKNAI